jgi:hypothetical protein
VAAASSSRGSNVACAPLRARRRTPPQRSASSRTRTSSRSTRGCVVRTPPRAGWSDVVHPVHAGLPLRRSAAAALLCPGGMHKKVKNASVSVLTSVDQCVVCPVGTWCSVGSAVAMPSALGTYNKQPRQGMCLKCAAGSFQELPPLRAACTTELRERRSERREMLLSLCERRFEQLFSSSALQLFSSSALQLFSSSALQLFSSSTRCY